MGEAGGVERSDRSGHDLTSDDRLDCELVGEGW